MEVGTESSSSSPPSPGVSPINLSDCIEELVRFTLSSSVDETLEIDLDLSRDYCTRLLQDHPPPANSNLNSKGVLDASGGVPEYPLFKHLARALERCISNGAFLRNSGPVEGIPEVESMEGEENKWSELIGNEGLELVNMYKAVEFELHVQEPFFSQLRAGRKTVEGRCAVGNYNRITPGVLLLFNKSLLLQVQNVKRYGSFSEMLKVETLTNVLPGIKTIEEGAQIYRNFYSEKKEKSNGVLAISVSKPDCQPYMSIAKILSGLSYEGVAGLLGMAHTVGTVPHVLPPPRSMLLSSFMSPHRTDVKGSSLTDGARALAKHVNRCSRGCWDSFGGNDCNKNKLAMEAINHLLTHCCWMNVHLIQPYECVFEIRVADGYGARWSKDGSKKPWHFTIQE